MPDTMIQPESFSRPPIAELASALCKAQAQMEGAKKDANNPHFKTNYADLASVWSAIREPLTKNGLSVVQPIGNVLAFGVREGGGETIRHVDYSFPCRG